MILFLSLYIWSLCSLFLFKKGSLNTEFSEFLNVLNSSSTALILEGQLGKIQNFWFSHFFPWISYKCHPLLLCFVCCSWEVWCEPNSLALAKSFSLSAWRPEDFFFFLNLWSLIVSLSYFLDHSGGIFQGTQLDLSICRLRPFFFSKIFSWIIV